MHSVHSIGLHKLHENICDAIEQSIEDSQPMVIISTKITIVEFINLPPLF